MKIKSMKTEDFMGLYGKREYDLSEQIVAFCDGNAKGKSSVLNALRYAIAGEKPEGEIITKGHPRTTVQLEFGGDSSITRMEFAKAGKPAAYFVDKKRSTLGAVNDKLTSMTGRAGGVPKLLAASDLLEQLDPQNFGKFLLGYLPETMTRDDLIDRLSEHITPAMEEEIRKFFPDGEFGTSVIDAFYSFCTERRKEIKKEITAARAVLTEYSRFPVPQETMEELTRTVKALENERDRAVAYATAKREYDRALRQAADHEKLIRDVQGKIGDSNPAQHTEDERKAAAVVLDAHRKTVTALYSSMQAMRQSGAALKKAIESIKQPVCPLSEKLVCTVDKSIILGDLEREYEKLCKEHNEKAREYAAEKEKAAAAEEVVHKIDTDIIEAKRIAGLKENLKRLRETMPSVPKEPAPAGDPAALAAKIDAAKQKIKYLQDAERMAGKKKALAQNEEILARFEALVFVFSPKGEAKAAVMRYYLDDFSSQCNKKAGKIFPGMDVKFIPENGVTILVDPKGTGEYISAASLSGGEKACLTFLLMSLLGNIAGLRVLILDELSVLDNDSMERFLSVLEENRDEYDLAVLACVDHEDTVRLLKEKGINMVSA